MVAAIVFWTHIIEGAAMTLPTDKTERKQRPIYSGVLQYFPRTMAAVAHCSWVGNEQHNPGEPLHWAREKSSDHHDCAIRHLMEAGSVDDDGVRHSVKAVWRMAAACELELEAAASDRLGQPHRIYVAAPYSENPTYWIHEAERIGIELRRRGHFVHVPHKATEGLERHGFDYEQILAEDFTYLDGWATALFYARHSPGADRELSRSRRNGLVVFSDLEQVPRVGAGRSVAIE